MIRAKVYVTLKGGVLDPQGETVKGALEMLGFGGGRIGAIRDRRLSRV